MYVYSIYVYIYDLTLSWLVIFVLLYWLEVVENYHNFDVLHIKFCCKILQLVELLQFLELHLYA